jgi:hypothetical protein
VTKESPSTSEVTDSTTTTTATTTTTTEKEDSRTENSSEIVEEVSDDNFKLESENLDEFMERMSGLIAKMVTPLTID